MNRIVSALLVGLAIMPFLTGIARAQIDYDAAKHAYFVTGDATINTDVSGNDVFVGKDNATAFNTLPGPITLTVADGANITYFLNDYPDGNSYYGLSVFGANFVNISGGTVNGDTYGFDTSSVTISGGTVESVRGWDASSVNISGGTVIDGAFGVDASSVNISGGAVNGDIYCFDTSSVNISGGAVNDSVYGNNTSSVNISGGTLQRQVYGSDASTVNVSGGMVKNSVNGFNASAVNISGGKMSSVNGYDTSSVNISGGTMTGVFGFGARSINISGGNVGGIDPDINNGLRIGVYELSGTVNLFGSDFARTGIFAGNSLGYVGTFSTLTGTLLDGTALNITFFLADGVTYEDLGGGTQDNPILPDSNNDGVFTFNGVPSGAWFDPPTVGAFDFAMLGGDFFTSILDFPSGIGDADGLFTVSVGGVALGQFSSGTTLNFADFGFAGGVSGFTVSGIDPTVDGGDATAFPIKLGFSSPFASFTMTGITGAAAAPEPGTLSLFAIGAVWAAGIVRRRKF